MVLSIPNLGVISLSWLDVESVKATLMIGKQQDERIWPKGTSVLLRYKESNILVTNKHIIQNIENPLILFNDKSGKINVCSTNSLKYKYGITWVFPTNPDIDLAAIPFGISVTDCDVHPFSDSAWAKFNEINLGHDVFFMGFPLGLFDQIRIIPTIRQGCVALKIERTMEMSFSGYDKKSEVQ